MSKIQEFWKNKVQGIKTIDYDEAKRFVTHFLANVEESGMLINSSINSDGRKEMQALVKMCYKIMDANKNDPKKIEKVIDAYVIDATEGEKGHRHVPLAAKIKEVFGFAAKVLTSAKEKDHISTARIDRLKEEMANSVCDVAFLSKVNNQDYVSVGHKIFDGYGEETAIRNAVNGALNTSHVGLKNRSAKKGIALDDRDVNERTSDIYHGR